MVKMENLLKRKMIKVVMSNCSERRDLTKHKIEWGGGGVIEN
jgi:hypothetical protein